MKKWQAYIGIVTSAIFWGAIPLFSRLLYAEGFDAITVPAIRGIISAVISVIGLIVFKDYKCIKVKEIPFYFVYGTLAIASCYICYALSIQLLSTAMAAVLLYTGPAFVIFFERIFFGVPITPVKWIAMIVTFVGCVVVVKAYDLASFQANLQGIIIGILSGLCYSTTTVLGTKARKKHSGRVNAWLIMSFSAIIFLFISPPWELERVTVNQSLLFAGMAITCSFIPYTLYLMSLDSEVDGGTASILATIEPVIATLCGVLFFHDELELMQIIGIVIVIVGVILPIIFEKTLKKEEV